MKRIIFAVALAVAVAVTVISFTILYRRAAAATKTFPPNDLVVHEWGTFTSIAGKNGVAIDWRPLNGPSDLPKFVYDETSTAGYRGNFHDGGKRSPARVRMETPVIYFYTKKEMDVDVSVDFPDGKITEWYPQAGLINAKYDADQPGLNSSNGIAWGTIKLVPNERPNYLREAAYSHYYPARETDSVPVRVCNADKTKTETEKFLFYRGIGNFNMPINVTLNKGKVDLEDVGRYPVKDLIVFENSGGKIGYRLVSLQNKRATVERPETSKTVDDVTTELEKILVSEGLYQKEARAMIATWKDSWFEEGLRVFYILPTISTHQILHLNVNPQPMQLVRVLVGRTEIITPEMERDVRKQAMLLKSPSAEVRDEASVNLKKHGRFYEPILKAILQSERDPGVREQIEKLLEVS